MISRKTVLVTVSNCKECYQTKAAITYIYDAASVLASLTTVVSMLVTNGN
jgi:hypothetical protein